ncbi:MAG: hypothetical protein JKY65_06585 [Planctomycetes bacterium]|nr:hypothetical protein [Planctomycetota bacterium]
MNTTPLWTAALFSLALLSPLQEAHAESYVVMRLVDGPAETRVLGVSRKKFPDWAKSARRQLARRVESAGGQILSAGVAMDPDWRRFKLPAAIELPLGNQGSIKLHVDRRHCRVDVVFELNGPLPSTLKGAVQLSPKSLVDVAIRAYREPSEPRRGGSTGREIRARMTLAEFALLQRDRSAFFATGAGAGLLGKWNRLLGDWASESELSEIRARLSFPQLRDVNGRPILVEGAVLSEKAAKRILGVSRMFWQDAPKVSASKADQDLLKQALQAASRAEGTQAWKTVQDLRLQPFAKLSKRDLSTLREIADSRSKGIGVKLSDVVDGLTGKIYRKLAQPVAGNPSNSLSDAYKGLIDKLK